mgnify:CR=1 FL=1
MYPQGADTATTAIDAAFVAQASRIGDDIYTDCLHTSPWLDLAKKAAFDEQYGLQQQVLLYDRALPTQDAAGNTDGVKWFGTQIEEATSTFNESLITGRQPIAGTANKNAGAYGGDQAVPAANLVQDQRSYIQFSKKIKQFTLRKADITAPKMNLEDLRYASHRQQQIAAIMELLTEATAYTWENRHRDEYENVTANVVFMLETGTKVQTTVAAGTSVTSVDAWELENLTDINKVSTSGIGDTDITPTAAISNKILDRIYTNLIRKGAGKKDPYGMQDGRPVFAIIASSESSHGIQTEAGYRAHKRYDSSKVSELLAPLGVERAHRGYYHLIDDLAPRYNITGDKFVRVEPYTTTAGITVENPAYENAKYEVAYIHHSMVSETQIPNPFGGANGLDFDAKSFTGKFNWYNIQSEENPDRQTGYFRGTLASATKPMKTEYGYTLVYDREVGTPAE